MGADLLFRDAPHTLACFQVTEWQEISHLPVVEWAHRYFPLLVLLLNLTEQYCNNSPESLMYLHRRKINITGMVHNDMEKWRYAHLQNSSRSQSARPRPLPDHQEAPGFGTGGTAASPSVGVLQAPHTRRIAFSPHPHSTNHNL